ncbi:hypothetical protein ACHAWU_000284 [Discostella pseudostelligera]|uniref:Uncharacterized protein n=1 Tax=Discostella pseudostelligera TaxID=259834 RepID=A0ABD3MEZ6_9STRA
MAASSPLSLLGFTATATATLLLLLHTPTNVLADCLVEGDMMFMEGQSIGTFGQVCVNETSYDNKDKVCGPNGEIILVTTSTQNCPSDIGTPYCVQCGSVEQGAALCLDTTDIPEVCSLTSDTGDDAFGNNMGMMGGNDDTFEMLPPSTPSSGISITFSTMISSMMDDSITFSSFDQCDNSADIAAWSLNNISNGDSSMQYCTTQWNGGCYFLGDCTQDCFVELGFSEGCSACFGEVAICFAENCQSSCEFDEESEACETCRLPCMEALDECSGVSAMLIDDSSSSNTTTSSSTIASSPTTANVSESTATGSTVSSPTGSPPSATITGSVESSITTTTTTTIPPPTSTTTLPSPDSSRTVVSSGNSIIASIPTIFKMGILAITSVQWITGDMF